MEYMALLSPRQFQEKHQELVMTLQSIFQRTRFSKKVPLEPVKTSINGILSLVDAGGVLNHLKKLGNDKKEYTYRHSVNVAVVAGLLGKWLGLEEAVRKDLVFAGLLHDIGKTQIPIDILNKPGNLTFFEMQTMKRHAILGYQLLQPHQEISKDIKLWILQHHERLDGSGYPHAFQGSQVCYHTQIIAVADIYDAMTSYRVYRNADTPFCAIDELSRKMFGKLDPGICKIFMEKLNESLLGNTVKLNNGVEAQIIQIDTRLGVKPLVKTMEGDYIDLEKSKELWIVEVYTD